jgi:hypothetical protein
VSRADTLFRVIIKPITVRLVTYGQKANVAAIRTRAAALLKDEHGQVPAAAFVAATAAEVHAEIVAHRLDTETVLRKPTPAQTGLFITLTEIHERMANEWLQELPVAKTCVVLATWASPRDGLAWQMLFADGDRWSESRPLASGDPGVASS